MTETLQEETREAPEMPLHMRREGFDPVREMAALRDDEGVRQVETAFGMPAFLVARHADVKAVLADSARFSNDSRRAFDAPGAPKLSDEERDRMRAGNLLGVDPPEHTRLRRMLTPEFTVRRMRRLEPRIVEIVDDHLDAMEKAGPPSDLVADFALPIPSLVICELLGVPYADRASFQAAHRASCSTSRCRWRSASSWAGRAASTWRTSSPGRRRRRARTCSACSCATTGTT